MCVFDVLAELIKAGYVARFFPTQLALEERYLDFYELVLLGYNFLLHVGSGVL